MNTSFRIAIYMVLAPAIARADLATFDFSTLAPLPSASGSGQHYFAYDQFYSDDVQFEVVPFPALSLSPVAYIAPSYYAPGSGDEVFLVEAGLNLLIPENAEQVSLLYGDFCCDNGLVINGDHSPLVSEIGSLHGTTLGGVTVEVIPWSESQGELVLNGLIEEFIIGGTELALDDFEVWSANHTAPGDYNADGTVDSQDYQVWKDSFGSTVDLAADGNGNRVIDTGDYNLFRDRLANRSPIFIRENSGIQMPGLESSPIPEPATIWLLLLAWTGSLAFYRQSLPCFPQRAAANIG